MRPAAGASQEDQTDWGASCVAFMKVCSQQRCAAVHPLQVPDAVHTLQCFL